jgi:uncharacterized protein (DUF1697 family)
MGTRKKTAGELRRYAALLRGVSPMNCRMPALKAALEKGGFAEVATLLSSGNALFSAPAQPEDELERQVEAALEQHLDRGFATLVRSVDQLRALLEADPFQAFELPPNAKRVVTFLRRAPRSAPALPIAADDAAILALRGRELFSAYVPGPKGPVFMSLIEKSFGKDLTTRTWDTVRRLAR